MVNCCVPGCKSRLNKDKKVYFARFPSTAYTGLREQWINNIFKLGGCKGWQPTVHDRVCEIHFPNEMWENHRADGRRKLKRNSAIPTVFPGQVANDLQNDDNANHSEDVQVTFVEKPDINFQDEDLDERDVSCEEHTNQEIPVPSTNNTTDFSLSDKKLYEDKIRELEKQLSDANKKVETADRMLGKFMKQRIQWRKTSLRQRRLIGQLKGQLRKLLPGIRKFLNDDQIRALTSHTTRGMKWSNETIKKSLRLKFACGSTGYDELQAQNIPIPSARTLRRKLEGIDFEEGISKKSFELLAQSTAEFADDRERDTVLVLDEMALKPSCDFDPSTEHPIFPQAKERQKLLLPTP